MSLLPVCSKASTYNPYMVRKRLSLHMQMWYLHFKRLHSWHKNFMSPGWNWSCTDLFWGFGQLVSTMNKHTTPSWKPPSCVHQLSTTLPVHLWLDTGCHGLTWVYKHCISYLKKQMPNVKVQCFIQHFKCQTSNISNILLQRTVFSPSTVTPPLGRSSREKETAWMKGMRPWHTSWLSYGVTESNSWLCNCNQAFFKIQTTPPRGAHR